MQHEHRPLLALVLRVGGALAFATMFMLSKWLGQRGVQVPEVMFWRQAVSLPILAGGLAATGQIGSLRTRRPGVHLARAMVSTIGLGLNLATFRLLHLSEATTLSFTTPLFVVVITALATSEKVGRWRWIAVGVGFAGVVLVTRPGSAAMPLVGIGTGLASALIAALIGFHLREMTRTESPVTVVFWFAVFGTMLAAPAMPFTYQPHSGLDWLMLVSLGLTGTVGQWLLTASLRHGAVASVAVMDYTQLLWATIYGWLIWGDLPQATIWLGAPLIVGSGLIIVWAGHVQARATVVTAAD